MKSLTICGVALIAVALVTLHSGRSPGVSSPLGSVPDTKARTEGSPGSMAVLFEENLGQLNDRIQFSSRGISSQVLLTAEGAAFWTTNSSMQGDEAPLLDIHFLNVSEGVKVVGTGGLASRTHYYVGNDSADWRTDVPNYKRVRLDDLYPGIDLVYYGTGARLEFDFVVRPGADTGEIGLSIGGVPSIALDERGNLVNGSGGELILEKPRAYQIIEDARQHVEADYFVKGNQVRIRVGDYDTRQTLVIDPVVGFSTYLGGRSTDRANDVAVDAEGYVYVVGETYALDFPGDTRYEFPSDLPSRDKNVFVTKMTPGGDRIVWTAFVGGRDHDTGYDQYGDSGNGIAIDDEGNVFVTGETYSASFPTVNAVQSTYGNINYECPEYDIDVCGDAFVFKLSSAGDELIYSTYIGGDQNDVGSVIGVDGSGNAYIIGLPCCGGLEPTPGAVDDEGSSVIKFDAAGRLGYHARPRHHARGLAVDDVGNVYLAFRGDSEGECSDFPRQELLRLNAAGSTKEFIGSFCGNTVTETLTVGADGRVYMAGTVGTNLDVLPAVGGPIQSLPQGEHDVFVAIWNGSSLTYCTYFGGNDSDWPTDIAVDQNGTVHVSGWTDSANLPVDADAFQQTHVGVQSAFAMGFDPSKSGLESIVYSTFLGGAGGVSAGEGVAVDATGNAYHVGRTWSSEFPTYEALQPNHGGVYDAFVFMIGDPLRIVVNSTGDTNDDVRDGQCWTGSYVSRDQTQEKECTLRAAIRTANETSGKTITFDVVEPPPSKRVVSSWPEITPDEALPEITAAMVIDASAKPVGLKGKPSIESGLHVKASQVTIKGLRISEFNWSGIRVEDAGKVTIGGSASGDGNTIWNNATGIYVEGAATSKVVVRGNCIGAEDCSVDLELSNENNVQIGIEVVNDASEVTIGGGLPGEGNRVLGGIVTRGDGTRRIAVHQNVLAVREGKMQGLGGEPLELPLDLGDDGPSCTSWTGATEPNGGMPPPRILKLTDDTVEGITRPHAAVDIYRVESVGIDRGRYFARHVEPEGRGIADGNGRFEISVSLSDNDLVTATATDDLGNTSELGQVIRPVVFVPGVGGSALADQNMRQLWLPKGLLGRQIQAIKDLALHKEGRTGDFAVQATEILETYPFSNRWPTVYHPILEELQNRGFYGTRNNTDEINLDLWRFPYDWRLRLEDSAEKLKELVGQITLDMEYVARSCEVDIVAHSMGGMVSAIYLRKPENLTHVRNRVHRFVSIATPYLGTPKVVASHTMGYVFELEKQKKLGANVFFNTVWVPWGEILWLARNMPAAYATMPSPLYWKAAIKSGGHYLIDFDNNPLTSPEATLGFLTAEKVDASGKPKGLGRNAQLWHEEQAAVQDVIGNWKDWQGPPQVFRLVGKLPETTAIKWRRNLNLLAERELQEDPREGDITREEPANDHLNIEGDYYNPHVQYRSALDPILGYGDGTVALVSASLGRHAGTGRGDYSGVGTSSWIEDFEVYPCKHFPIVEGECKRADGSRSLDRVVEILRSGYKVTPASVPKTNVSDFESDHAQEIVYVVGSRPFVVHVEDGLGVHTGPTWADSLMEYGLSEIGYWHNDRTTTVSLPTGKTYTLMVETPTRDGTIHVARIRPSGPDQSTSLLFPIQELKQGGSISWVADDLGSNLNLDVDVNGDGTTVLTVPPAANVQSTEVAPAIPQPSPIRFDEVALRTDMEDPEIVIHLPESGGSSWQWSCETTAPWILPADTSGRTPQQITATLAATSLPLGEHVETLWVALEIEGFETRYPVAVRLSVAESLALTAIDVTPRYAAVALGETVQFSAVGLDQRGDPFDFNPSWSATGGTIDGTGLYTAGQAPGSYEVGVTDPASGVRGTAKVTVSSGVGLDGEARSLPTEFRLYGNYPNPFNPRTTIGYDVPRTSDMTLAVYDVLGRQLRVLTSGTKPAGRYAVAFDAFSLPSGVYFYRLQAGDYVETKRMVVVK